mmetsp:Transcript_13418/g.28710  ORF Transcript_13418/g.28710 Transcript_13418/m.28710 type:complete len:253 (-) Transcript_13418:1135-1893(-)
MLNVEVGWQVVRAFALLGGDDQCRHPHQGQHVLRHLLGLRGGPVHEQHCVVHHLVPHAQLVADLQQAGYEGGALLDVGGAHVGQDQAMCRLKVLHSGKRLGAVLQHLLLTRARGVVTKLAWVGDGEQAGNLCREGLADHPVRQLRAGGLQHCSVHGVLDRPEGCLPEVHHGCHRLLHDAVALLLADLTHVSHNGHQGRQLVAALLHHHTLDVLQPAVKAQHGHTGSHGMQVQLHAASLAHDGLLPKLPLLQG